MRTEACSVWGEWSDMRAGQVAAWNPHSWSES
jgi:hypothetical protein